jgi:hypothetical protein
MLELIGFIIALLILAVLVWGGDGLIKLAPGNEKLKQVARILGIVVLTILCLRAVAAYFHIPVPLLFGDLSSHHR